MRTTMTTALVAVAAGLLALPACGTDGAGDDGGSPADGPTTIAEVGTVAVTAVDYAFEGVPDEVAAGTTVTLRNDSESEVHEVLALRVADDEDRSVEELLGLPPEELMQAVEVRGVAMAPPGGSSTEFPAPPLALEEPGRYLFACFIPTGAPPDEVLQAAQEFMEAGATEGEPDYPQTGPPHAANGMFAEVTVTAG